jgi:hypothetical protein
MVRFLERSIEVRARRSGAYPVRPIRVVPRGRDSRRLALCGEGVDLVPANR